MIGRLTRILNQFGLEYFNRYYSIYRAQVFDNDDPKKLNRLQLVIPQISGSSVYKHWAISFGMPGESGGVGIKHTPRKGEIVWVQFEGGDARHPVWSHGYWGNKESPDVGPKVQQWKTASGQMIRFDDEKKEITIVHSSGYEIILRENTILVGTNGVEIEVGKDSVKLNSGSTLSVKKGGVFIGNDIDNFKSAVGALKQAVSSTQTSPTGGPFPNLTQWIAAIERMEQILSTTK